jgi:hypothetical protein
MFQQFFECLRAYHLNDEGQVLLIKKESKHTFIVALY